MKKVSCDNDTPGIPGLGVVDSKLKEFQDLESKYNNAHLDQYLMGIKQVTLDKKLDFKKYFTNALTSNPLNNTDNDSD